MAPIVVGVALAGLVLALAGQLGPWIPHRTAALIVTGFELSEWAKFFPEVQAGALRVSRELFLLPLVAVAVELALLVNAAGRVAAAHGHTVRSLMLRILVTALALVLALSALPPLQLLRDATYRPRLLLSLAGALGVLVSPLASWAPRRVVAAVAAALALAAAALPVWQFTLLHPLFVALYAAPVGVGWGVFVCPIGLTLVALAWLLGESTRGGIHRRARKERRDNHGDAPGS